MKKPPADLSQLTQAAWSLMFNYLISTSEARQASLARQGLTPNDARALWSLDEGLGKPIGELARQWSCDPSNATFIIDRLERAELAQRRTKEGDRRVKLVFLTPKGLDVKKGLWAEYHTPPPEMYALSRDDLQNLVRTFKQLDGFADK